MPNTLGEVLGAVVAILAVAAATAASLYLLVLAPREPIYAIIAIFLFAAFISLLYFGFMKLPAAPPPPPQPQVVSVVSPPVPTALPPPPPPQETITYIARLETRDGKVVPITSVRQALGRKDFEKLVDPALARAISREHFTIFYDFRAGRFYIEDRSSTNGTLLNGMNIRGKGPVELKEGDTISPAGVLNLTFKIGS